MTMVHLIRMTGQNDQQVHLGYDTVCCCLRVLACCRLAVLLATAHQADRQDNWGRDTLCVFQRLCLPTGSVCLSLRATHFHLQHTLLTAYLASSSFALTARFLVLTRHFVVCAPAFHVSAGCFLASTWVAHGSTNGTAYATEEYGRPRHFVVLHAANNT